MSDNFQMLSDAEHIRKRFAMYGGSKDLQKEEIFLNQQFQQVEVVAGLLKVINEIIDNSIDEYVRTKGEYANEIKVTLKDDVITVEDNGRGIPSVKVQTPDGEKWQLEAAFTHARAGSNFDDDNRESIGANGVGSMITFVTSETFNADAHNNGTCVSLRSRGHTNVKTTTKSTTQNGTKVWFKPEYDFFGLSGLDETHVAVIQNRVKTLALAFPDIAFKFNGRRIRTNEKDFFGDANFFKTEKASFGIRKSNGNFESFSIVNGLSVKGGSHIDYITWNVGQELRALIKRRKKIDITLAKLKNHLCVFATVNSFKALKFDSQTKERITNSTPEVREAIGEFDAAAVAKRLFKDQELIDEICAVYELQQKLAAKKDLQSLEKKKRIKSEKYFSAVGKTERIFLVEGDSASGGLIKCLGRKGNAFYALKGVPLNVLEVSHQKFMANKELSELYQILNNFDEAEVIIAADADADGSRISGLLFLFMQKYFPERPVSKLYTPLAVGRKGNEVKAWAYTFEEVNSIPKGLSINYIKGLGSLDPKVLQIVMEKDGFDKMVRTLEIDDETLFANWFSGSTSDFRKDRIMEKEGFNIEKI